MVGEGQGCRLAGGKTNRGTWEVGQAEPCGPWVSDEVARGDRRWDMGGQLSYLRVPRRSRAAWPWGPPCSPALTALPFTAVGCTGMTWTAQQV